VALRSTEYDTSLSRSGSSPRICMLATHGFVPLAAGTPSAQTHPAIRPAGPGTVDPAAPVGVDPPVAAVSRWAGAIWHEVEEKRRLPRLSKGTRQPRVASARPTRRERGARVHGERQVQRPARARRWGISDAGTGGPCGGACRGDRRGAWGTTRQGGRPRVPRRAKATSRELSPGLADSRRPRARLVSGPSCWASADPRGSV
jgi:hypothetical protein